MAAITSRTGAVACAERSGLTVTGTVVWSCRSRSQRSWISHQLNWSPRDTFGSD